jgi:hypothetical protein
MLVYSIHTNIYTYNTYVHIRVKGIEGGAGQIRKIREEE